MNLEFCAAKRDVAGILAQIPELAGLLGDYDQVWLVVDADYNDLTDVVSRAQSRDVRPAISNPCFDLWLLLHFIDQRASVQPCDEAGRALRNALPGWTKGSTDYEDFRKHVPTACARARMLEPTGQDPRINPSSAVWLLVEQIDTLNSDQEQPPGGD